MLHPDIERELRKAKVLNKYTSNGFVVTVRQETLNETDRKIADCEMRKQFLEYT